MVEVRLEGKVLSWIKNQTPSPSEEQLKKKKFTCYMYNFAFFPLVLLLIYNVLITIYYDSAALIEEK